MSFKIDDTEWKPKTAQEHTDSIMNRLNAILQENNVQDEKGNVIQLTANFSNALYLLALGCGHRFFDNDLKLSQAINSFNIELCDDDQIANLLPIAAIERNSGSYSTLNLIVTASESGDATVPAGTRAQFEDVYFVVKTDALIPAGTSQVVPTVCDTAGAITVLSGEITGFETQIANVESVINLESSIPGVNPESTNDVRKRLITGNTIKYTLDGCQKALEELTGVAYARIYFNYDVNATLELPGNAQIRPRHAYIVVYGDNEDIAETYATYMNAPTQNNENMVAKASTVLLTVTASGTGSATIPQGTTCTYNGYQFETDEAVTIPATESADIQATCTVTGNVVVPKEAITAFDETIENVASVVNMSAAIPGYDDPKDSQTWTTASGQDVTIYFDHAVDKLIFVKVVLKSDSDNSEEIDNQLTRDLIKSSAEWGIGEDITSLITSVPFSEIQYAKVAYTQVSLDGETWSNIIEIGCFEVPRVAENTIVIDQLEDNE